MNRCVFILVIVFFSLSSAAQMKAAYTKASATAFPYRRHYHPAEFPGGNAAMHEYIEKHIVYPDAARENNIAGKVVLKFFVDEQGGISKIEVIRSVDPSLDAAAKMVAGSMPRWNPAKYKKRAVPSFCLLPIVFELR